VAALKAELNDRGIDVAVLESDVLREILTPSPRYDEEERERFYQQMAYIGALLVQYGVPVIFDATANRQHYRDHARGRIPRFLEVYVTCPLEVCIARDPKGIYRKGREGALNAVPGLQAIYEPPDHPDVTVQGSSEAPAAASQRIIAELDERGYLQGARAADETIGGGN
jgi:adenylylsulfate kinase